MWVWGLPDARHSTLALSPTVRSWVDGSTCTTGTTIIPVLIQSHTHTVNALWRLDCVSLLYAFSELVVELSTSTIYCRPTDTNSFTFKSYNVAAVFLQDKPQSNAKETDKQTCRRTDCQTGYVSCGRVRPAVFKCSTYDLVRHIGLRTYSQGMNERLSD